MSRPDPHGPLDRTPITVGEIWENPITGEHATILERPWDNSAGRATAELTALVGARVVGEHRHPAHIEQVTVLEGELTMKREERVSVLPEGQTAVSEPGVWHDWWNERNRDARVRVDITPGERFVHMIETFYGLARLGHTDGEGMPHPLQLGLSAREFSEWRLTCASCCRRGQVLAVSSRTLWRAAAEAPSVRPPTRTPRCRDVGVDA